jgi:hypothetical protein
MTFSPGQYLTAQRLNRLQTKTYFGSASGAITTVGSGNVAGTALAITTETDGATVACSWTAAVYATGAMGNNCNTYVKYDLGSSSVFALAQLTANTEKTTAANFWSAAIATANSYTFQLGYTVTANGSLAVYTSLMVQVMEVA